MDTGEQSRAAGAHGNDIVRESSSGSEPLVRPPGRRSPHSPRLPRRWSWRFRMPSRHLMTLRSHSRGIIVVPSGSLLAGVQPPRRGTTVQRPQGNEAGRVPGNPVTLSRPTTRARFRGLSETQDIVIFDDAENQETPQGRTPVLYSGSSEDKENNKPEPVEGPAHPHSDVDDFDRSILEFGPRDVFGLPVLLPIGHFDRATYNDQEIPVRGGQAQVQEITTPQVRRVERPGQQHNLRPRNI